MGRLPHIYSGIAASHVRPACRVSLHFEDVRPIGSFYMTQSPVADSEHLLSANGAGIKLALETVLAINASTLASTLQNLCIAMCLCQRVRASVRYGESIGGHRTFSHAKR